MHTRVNDCLLMTSLPGMADTPEFLDRTEAAALLRVHVRTLDRWSRTWVEKGGPVRVGRTPGGAPRYPRADLLALLDPGRVPVPRSAPL